MRGLEVTTRGIVGTLAVLIVAAVCVRLGIWQLDRRADRLDRNRAVAERVALPPVTLDALPPDTAGLTFRRAVVAGPVDDDRAIILAGRSRNGAPGVHLLSPVRIGGGALLVNRGWLPAADAATIDLDAARLRGEIRAEGVLTPFPDVDVDPPDGFQVRWFRVDGESIRGQYPYPVASLYLVTTAPVEPGSDDGGRGEAGSDATDALAPAPLEPPRLEPGPHLSYAVQWFSFAAIALIGWVVLLVRRTDDG
ncbi:MAG: SURF1 family protein [Longimicrobiales bacterium]|nr:SURF1 family protein [Longimicrobiales bacterium]